MSWYAANCSSLDHPVALRRGGLRRGLPLGEVDLGHVAAVAGGVGVAGAPIGIRYSRGPSHPQEVDQRAEEDQRSTVQTLSRTPRIWLASSVRISSIQNRPAV